MAGWCCEWRAARGLCFLYSETARPGLGTALEKHCAACNINYRAHGFVRNAEEPPPGNEGPSAGAVCAAVGQP